MLCEIGEKLGLLGLIAYPWRVRRRSGVSWAVNFGASLILMGGGLGCAHETAEERQLASLSQGVDKDQSAIDRDAPRINEKAEIGPSRSAARSAATPGRGNVQAIGEGATDPQAGDSALNGEDPNDTTPRPVIRVVGVRRAQRGVHGLDQVDETIPDEPTNGGAAGPPLRSNAPGSQAAALDTDARKAYDAALALVNAHQYDQALDAFAAFLVRWPDHPNADNAMYWRGESYYAKGEFARAVEEFEGATLRFPYGNKAPDCLLKLGLSEQKLGNLPKAQSYFERLMHDYPRSDAARRIPAQNGHGVGPQENP
jgi:tol-pal system protein YbgF